MKKKYFIHFIFLFNCIAVFWGFCFCLSIQDPNANIRYSVVSFISLLYLIVLYFILRKESIDDKRREDRKSVQVFQDLYK